MGKSQYKRRQDNSMDRWMGFHGFLFARVEHRGDDALARGRVQEGRRTFFLPENDRIRRPLEPPPSQRSNAYLVFVTFAMGKSTVPVPPPTSRRILTSSRLPSLLPAAAHALKCSVTEIVPHVLLSCRIL